MKRFLIWTILVVLIGSTGTISARSKSTRRAHQGPMSIMSAGAIITKSTSTVPFIRIITSPDEIDLGTAVFFAGVHEVPGALKVQVDANCMHGPVVISTTPLERQGGGQIEPDDIFVRAPITGGYVSLKKPVVILPSAPGSQEVEVDFKVHAGTNHPSGQYKGIITLTIAPPV